MNTIWKKYHTTKLSNESKFNSISLKNFRVCINILQIFKIEVTGTHIINTKVPLNFEVQNPSFLIG